MSLRAYNHKLSFRIAEESQLLAEDRWLIEALSRIKKQRNSLQIERLHLESMKVKLTQSECPNTNRQVDIETPTYQFQTTETESQAQASDSASLKEQLLLEDSKCNVEELDLAVTKSVFQQMGDQYEMEEEEEEEEEEEDDYEDMVVEIGLLMNGKTM